MAKRNDNNIFKWLLLLAGVGVGVYAFKKSAENDNAQATPAQAAPAQAAPEATPAQAAPAQAAPAQAAPTQAAPEATTAQAAPTQAAPEATTQTQTQTQTSIPTEIYQAVDDFVDAINNQVSASQKIKILNRLQTQQEVEQFKKVCKDIYALSFNDLLTYLDNAELAALTEALLNTTPQMYLFEGMTAPETKARGIHTSYSSSSEPIDPSTVYKGRSGNSSTSSTSSSRSSSSTNEPIDASKLYKVRSGNSSTSSSRSSRSSRSTNSSRSSRSSRSINLMNPDELKILLM